MPIWSLTKERVEKLLRQVGDKEMEIDTLIKLTKEDLWTRDLDDFLAEWRFQLDDEAKRQKKVASMGRRASKKLNIAGGAAGRKRKNDSDDDDFNVAPVKVKKTAIPKKEVGGLLSYMMPETKTKVSPKSKAKAPTATQKAAKKALDLISTSAKGDKDDVWMNVDGSGSDAPKVTKPKAASSKAALPPKKAEPAPKKTSSDDDDDDADEEIIRPTAGRKPRGATAKPITYNLGDSDSDGDDMLFNVGKMVKGIDTASVPAEKSRPLFSASISRPGSSTGLPKKSTSSKPAVDIDSDDTNYSKLAPPTTKKGPAVTARKTILSDDDDDSLDDMIPAPHKASKPAPKATAKPAPKPKAPAPAKKATKAAPPPPEPTKMPLSPAAKAYAAKKAKAEKAALKANSLSEDELEGLANEILDEGEDSEDEGGPAARRPARRAASAAPKKKWVISDDDDDEDELEESTMQFDDGDSDE